MRRRRSIAERGVGSDLVVVATPAPDQDLRLLEAAEYLAAGRSELYDPSAARYRDRSARCGALLHVAALVGGLGALIYLSMLDCEKASARFAEASVCASNNKNESV